MKYLFFLIITLYAVVILVINEVANIFYLVINFIWDFKISKSAIENFKTPVVIIFPFLFKPCKSITEYFITYIEFVDPEFIK